MIINFECHQCHRIFDCDIGQVNLSKNASRPRFGKAIVCPDCGERTLDEVHLTEQGQGQLTDAVRHP